MPRRRGRRELAGPASHHRDGPVEGGAASSLAHLCQEGAAVDVMLGVGRQATQARQQAPRGTYRGVRGVRQQVVHTEGGGLLLGRWTEGGRLGQASWWRGPRRRCRWAHAAGVQ